MIWNSMESAPKDGTWVLIRCDHFDPSSDGSPPVFVASCKALPEVSGSAVWFLKSFSDDAFSCVEEPDAWASL